MVDNGVNKIFLFFWSRWVEEEEDLVVVEEEVVEDCDNLCL